MKTPNHASWSALAAAVALLTFSTAGARAALLAYEGFNYPVGNLATNTPGGTGWGSNWTESGANTTKVITNSLDYTGLAETGNKGSANFGANAYRLLDVSGGGTFGLAGYVDGNGDIGADGETLWFSFLIQDNQNAPGFGFRRDTNSVFYVSDIQNTNLWDVGQQGGGQESLFATNIASTTSPATQMWLGKIVFASGNDTLSLWLNPTLAGGEAGLGAALVTASTNFAFDEVTFSFGGNSVSFIDEIQFGETAADIGLVIPEPSAVFLLGTGAGTLLLLRRRR